MTHGFCIVKPAGVPPAFKQLLPIMEEVFDGLDYPDGEDLFCLICSSFFIFCFLVNPPPTDEHWDSVFEGAYTYAGATAPVPVMTAQPGHRLRSICVMSSMLTANLFSLFICFMVLLLQDSS